MTARKMDRQMKRKRKKQRKKKKARKSHTIAADALPSSTNNIKNHKSPSRDVSPFIFSAALIESVLLWIFIILQHFERQFANHTDFQLSFKGYFNVEGWDIKIKPL